MGAHQGGYHEAQRNPTKQLVSRIIRGTAKPSERFIPDHTTLIEVILELRAMGCVVVLILGVWDLFHMGHALFIHQGKEEAKKLYPDAEHIIAIIGVDSDAFTKSRKGPERPIVPEDERVTVLGHLREVDILTLQYEADQLFKLIEHDVRVISQSTQDLPGLELIKSQCKHVVNLPPQAETSTTARIRRLNYDGGIETLLKVKTALTNALQEIELGLKP
ncbi:MAG: D-alpha,beta-d-heptose 7-phosphate 1-kinase, d-beta-d-heptose 1-phosphate adenylyltransferase [Parcubacteria group bacterium]|nr:D-alpha,beta-d-heptose 7-phosphate 1-kinase, d-beta-d-heptose 1-phosphate adenylyltransferase [Parcubacteria group bacterium]